MQLFKLLNFKKLVCVGLSLNLNGKKKRINRGGKRGEVRGTQGRLVGNYVSDPKACLYGQPPAPAGLQPPP